MKPPDIVITHYGYNDSIRLPSRWHWIKRRRAIRSYADRMTAQLAEVLARVRVRTDDLEG